jgi:hypothetical protein
MSDYNTVLQQWVATRAGHPEAGAKGDEGSIERPDQVRNIRWQTRVAAPTEYENALGDALQKIFADQVHDLPGIVSRLNASTVRAPGGVTWTEDIFTAEMTRLGF